MSKNLEQLWASSHARTSSVIDVDEDVLGNISMLPCFRTKNGSFVSTIYSTMELPGKPKAELELTVFGQAEGQLLQLGDKLQIRPGTGQYEGTNYATIIPALK